MVLAILPPLPLALPVERIVIVHLIEELLLVPLADLFEMHEVAIASALTIAISVLLATSLIEVRDRTVLRNDQLAIVQPARQSLATILSILLLRKLHIDIAQ